MGEAETCEIKLVSKALSIRIEHVSLCDLLEGLSPWPNKHLFIPYRSLWAQRSTSLSYSIHPICSGCLPNYMNFGSGQSYKQPLGIKQINFWFCRSILWPWKEPVLEDRYAGRAKYAQQWLMTTGWENLTVALGYTETTLEIWGMYGLH